MKIDIEIDAKELAKPNQIGNRLQHRPPLNEAAHLLSLVWRQRRIVLCIQLNPATATSVSQQDLGTGRILRVALLEAGDAAEAHRLMESSQHVGKILLRWDLD